MKKGQYLIFKVLISDSIFNQLKSIFPVWGVYRETGFWREGLVSGVSLRRADEVVWDCDWVVSSFRNHCKKTMSEEIQEIHSLISSDDKFNKSSGYSSLLQFQQHSCVNASSLQFLAHSAQSIISSIVSDIVDDHDEEMWAQTSTFSPFNRFNLFLCFLCRIRISIN